MSRHHSLIKRITQFAMILMMGVSMSSCASNEYKTWQEEVKLNDGRVIVVTQKKRCSGAYTGGNYASCIAREAWLTLKLPELGNQEIVWHEHLSPRVLNVDKGRLYVVGDPPTGLEFRTYGKPQPAYVGFVLEGTQWKRISFAEIPEAIYDTNMLLDAFPPDDMKFLSLSKKASKELNGNPYYTKEQNRIDPKYKTNFH